MNLDPFKIHHSEATEATQCRFHRFTLAYGQQRAEKRLERNTGRFTESRNVTSAICSV